MEETTVRRTDDGAIATLTVDRPEKMNAANRQVLDELNAHLDALEVDEKIGAVIITGAGEAFVAGADINELAKRTPIDGLEAFMQRTYDRIDGFSKPTIAAVNGYALGGGCELSVACDIRIAAESAVFGLPETGLGIIPAAGATQRLTALTGRGPALDMIITGRRVTAQEALQWGLCTYVTSNDDLMEQAFKIAERICRKGPTAVALARQVVKRGEKADPETGLLLERLAQAVLYSTAEKTEGTRAFLEKRHPDFSQARKQH